MKRTQIYLSEKMAAYLEKESVLRKKTMSEIIRESIEHKMLKGSNEILKRIDSVFGIWKDKKIDVDSYIRDIRKDRKIWS